MGFRQQTRKKTHVFVGLPALTRETKAGRTSGHTGGLGGKRLHGAWGTVYGNKS